MTEIIEHLKNFQTLYAACIGAIGLVITFLITAKMTFKFHKSDKLAEARLNVYLDLIEKYVDFIIYLELNSQGVFLENSENEKLIMRKYKDILINYNKFCLISSSTTKKQSVTLMNGLQKVYEMAQNLDTKNDQKVFIFMYTLKAVENDGIRFSWVLRKELDVPTNLKIEQSLI